jgi:hypothetical protein
MGKHGELPGNTCFILRRCYVFFASSFSVVPYGGMLGAPIVCHSLFIGRAKKP